MKNKLILIILLLPSCVQPNLVQQTKPSISPTSNVSNIQVTKVVESVKPSQSVVIESVKPSTVESDGNLATKITDIVPTPIITVTPSPTGTATTYTNTPINTSPSIYNLPIKPEDRGTGQPATVCDAYGQESTQCKDYLNSLKPSPPPYSQSYPIPADRDYGEISVIFKDEYKIRYDISSNKFISLVGSDVNSLNELIFSVNPKVSQPSIFGEEKSEYAEKLREKECNCDVPNAMSSYYINVINTNLVDYVTKLRNHIFVREANIGAISTNHNYIPSSEQPIQP